MARNITIKTTGDAINQLKNNSALLKTVTDVLVIVNIRKNHISIIKPTIFYVWFASNQVWFRLFGIGLCIRNISLHPLVFSERQGCKKYFRVGSWIITYLSHI